MPTRSQRASPTTGRVGADFNTDPNSLIGRQGYAAIPTPTGILPAIIATGQPTQASGRELDYAVTTTPSAGLLQANLLPSQGGSDHDPVQVIQTPTRPAPTTAPEPTYSFDPMPVGGYAVNGNNQSASTLGYAGMRQPVRACMVQRGSGCAQYHHPSDLAQAAAAGSVNFDYVGSVTAGDVAAGEDEEDAFPGATIAQIQQHLVTDLPTYKPDVILLQLDIANDLDSGATTSQEASELHNLLNQIYYILPNTTVLLGDPTPSINPSIENEIYSGSGSYISQSGQIVADETLAGHRIATVPLDFEDNTADLDTTAGADGVPNYNGYEDMADNYAGVLLTLEQAGTIVDPGAVIVNPSGILALTASRPLRESPAILTAWKAAHRSASGHQGGYEMREIVNAILYQSRTGCQWEYLPHDLPSRSAAYYYFARWRDDSTDQAIHDLLRWHAQEKKGRKADPSLVVLDTQSVHSAASVPAATTGKDAGKLDETYLSALGSPWTTQVLP